MTKPKDRKSTRLNSSDLVTAYAVCCCKKKKNKNDVVGDAVEADRTQLRALFDGIVEPGWAYPETAPIADDRITDIGVDPP